MFIISWDFGIRISIHTLRMESDDVDRVKFLIVGLFQSTLSVWRVTIQDYLNTIANLISIHTLRMESDVGYISIIYTDAISIHTLRMESDAGEFQRRKVIPISIHTLRMESDCGSKMQEEVVGYFNPHSPYGE